MCRGKTTVDINGLIVIAETHLSLQVVASCISSEIVDGGVKAPKSRLFAENGSIEKNPRMKFGRIDSNVKLPRTR